MSVRLIVQRGQQKGKEITLPKGEIIVGRKRGCHIRLGDARVSRHHCKIICDGESAVVEDLDSANGTLVNGTRVKRARLKPGDLLQIGGIIFTVAGEEKAEVADETVAVMGQPPGEPQPSTQEAIASAMAAMAQAEGEPAGPIEVGLNIPQTTPQPAPATGKPEEEPVELELAPPEPEEEPPEAGPINIDWQTASTEEEKEKDQ